MEEVARTPAGVKFASRQCLDRSEMVLNSPRDPI
jgi:hypothetical protein